MSTEARKSSFIPKHLFLKGSVPSDFVPKRAMILPSRKIHSDDSANETDDLTNSAAISLSIVDASQTLLDPAGNVSPAASLLPSDTLPSMPEQALTGSGQSLGAVKPETITSISMSSTSVETSSIRPCETERSADASELFDQGDLDAGPAILPFPSLDATNSAAIQPVASVAGLPQGLTAPTAQPAEFAEETVPSYLQSAFQFLEHAPVSELTDLTPEEEWLSRMLGRPLTVRDRESFYWEDYVEPIETKQEFEPETNPKNLTGILAVCCSSIEYIGRCILITHRVFSKIFMAIPNKTAAGEENNKVFTKKKGFYASDLMISVITGVCIATFIIFPLLRVVGEEVFTVVAKSVVRHMGERVSLSAMGSDASLLPILSEQFIFPKLDNSEGSAQVVGEQEIVIPLEE